MLLYATANNVISISAAAAVFLIRLVMKLPILALVFINAEDSSSSSSCTATSAVVHPERAAITILTRLPPYHY